MEDVKVKKETCKSFTRADAAEAVHKLMDFLTHTHRPFTVSHTLQPRTSRAHLEMIMYTVTAHTFMACRTIKSWGKTTFRKIPGGSWGVLEERSQQTKLSGKIKHSDTSELLVFAHLRYAKQKDNHEDRV